MQNKIVFLDASSLGENNLKDKLQQLGTYTEYQTTSPDETLSRCKEANIVLTNKVILDKEILNALKDTLKLVCITATGMNNVDLQTAKNLGIEVKNVAGYSTKSVAQHTLMMALALSAKLPFYDSYCKSREYTKSPIFTNLSTPLELLNGKKWGIIGLGTIGLEVARLANAFGAEVNYYSTSGKNQNPNYTSLPLDALLQTSSIISIHAPLNEATQDLINKNNLCKIKEGGILINVGRGGIVNESDLAEEMQKREIYAGFDVFTKEPMIEKHHFLNTKIANEIIIKQHNTWGYEDSKEFLSQGLI